ncbi:hypothetical protein M9Y10_019018 [Tritrichomonas musculus]|uniref:DUF3447 domain-containing protein n=1 Tax=Tritrichomonas musculus TaxID=1915356 RepID=A0ABR2HK99_9EUKA
MNAKSQEELLEEIKEYATKMTRVQKYFLVYLDKDTNIRSNFQNLYYSIKFQKILVDEHKMREFLYLVSEISSNHYRTPSFFSKIEEILKKISKEITKIISSEDIFNIFCNNYRILLFLFKEKIIQPNINLITRLLNINDSEEIRKCFNIKNNPKLSREKNDEISINEAVITSEIPKYGENNDEICQIIRNDSIDDFLSKKVNINLTFEPSIYETNEFLKDKTPSIIEYSAFYGSLKIFKYACSNNAELTNSLWIYAIHGRNMKIIQELENLNIDPPYRSFEDSALQLIKCHHNELTDFIINQRLNNEFQYPDDQKLSELHLLLKSFEAYNFEFISQRFGIDFDSNKNEIFPEICKFDYFYIIQNILAIQDIDINAQTIFI